MPLFLRIAIPVVLSFSATSQPAVSAETRPLLDSRPSLSAYSVRASDVIGADVVNSRNEVLGEVDDIVIVRSNNWLHAIIASGGVLGVGERLVAVDFDEIQLGASNTRVFLDVSLEAFRQRPRFRYNDGEPRGRALWERRLALKERLQEERGEVHEAQRRVEDERQDVRVLEKKLNALPAPHTQ